VVLAVSRVTVLLLRAVIGVLLSWLVIVVRHCVASLPGFVIVVLRRRHLLVVVGQVRWVGTEVLTHG